MIKLKIRYDFWKINYSLQIIRTDEKSYLKTMKIKLFISLLIYKFNNLENYFQNLTKTYF